MVDHSHRGFFFVATALMCGVMFYGSELASADSQELAASTTALPRQLTLPPGLKSAVPPELTLQSPLEEEPCAKDTANGASCAAAFRPAGREPEEAQAATAVKAEPVAVTNLGAAAR